MGSHSEEHILEDTKALVNSMLGFLDSSSDEEEIIREFRRKRRANKHFNLPKGLVYLGDKRGGNADGIDVESASGASGDKENFKLWSGRDISKLSKKQIETIWRPTSADGLIGVPIEHESNSGEPSLENGGRNSYNREVNRALFGKFDEQPEHGSPEYFEAAQNYATYGNNFLDFPNDLSGLWNAPATPIKPVGLRREPPGFERHQAVHETYGGGAGDAFQTANQTFPLETISTSMATLNQTFSPSGGDDTSIRHTYHLSSSPGSKRGYSASNSFTMMTPGVSNANPSANGSSASSSKQQITYVATPIPSPMVFKSPGSQPHYIAARALPPVPGPGFMYPGQLISPQPNGGQCVNTYFKETTQYMTNNNVSGGGTVYERLVYAQLMQQRFFQHQSAAMAAFFHAQQQQQAPTSHSTYTTYATHQQHGRGYYQTSTNGCGNGVGINGNCINNGIGPGNASNSITISSPTYAPNRSYSQVYHGRGSPNSQNILLTENSTKSRASPPTFNLGNGCNSGSGPGSNKKESSSSPSHK